MQIVTSQEFLVKKSILIEQIDYYIFDLLEQTLLSNPNGVGLSAPQIGFLKQAFIIKCSNKIMCFANPSLIKGDKSIDTIEGCLSIPNKFFKVRRFEQVIVSDDVNGIIELGFPLSIVWQHELDHLEGLTLIQTGEEVNNVSK